SADLSSAATAPGGAPGGGRPPRPPARAPARRARRRCAGCGSGPLRFSSRLLQRPRDPELVQGARGLAAHGATGDAEDLRDLAVGEILVIAQHQHGTHPAGQPAQLGPEVGVVVGVERAALGHGRDEVLAVAAPPGVDVQPHHGGAHVALGAVLLAYARPRVAQPGQRLLDEVGRVLAVAGQYVAVPEESVTPGPDELVERMVHEPKD